MSFHRSQRELSKEDQCFLRTYKIVDKEVKNDKRQPKAKNQSRESSCPKPLPSNSHLMHYVEAFHELYIARIADKECALSEEEMLRKMEQLKGVLTGMLIAAGNHFDGDPKEVCAAIDNMNSTIDKMATGPMDPEIIRLAYEERSARKGYTIGEKKNIDSI